MTTAIEMDWRAAKGLRDLSVMGTRKNNRL
jgi:hypothetical protein